jgi:hypothetical protein
MTSGCRAAPLRCQCVVDGHGAAVSWLDQSVGAVGPGLYRNKHAGPRGEARAALSLLVAVRTWPLATWTLWCSSLRCIHHCTSEIRSNRSRLISLTWERVRTGAIIDPSSDSQRNYSPLGYTSSDAPSTPVGVRTLWSDAARQAVPVVGPVPVVGERTPHLRAGPLAAPPPVHDSRAGSGPLQVDLDVRRSRSSTCAATVLRILICSEKSPFFSEPVFFRV